MAHIAMAHTFNVKAANCTVYECGYIITTVPLKINVILIRATKLEPPPHKLQQSPRVRRDNKQERVFAHKYQEYEVNFKPSTT